MAGVGAILTQHRTDPRLGPAGIALLRSGQDAEAAVAASAGRRGGPRLAPACRHRRDGPHGRVHGSHIRSIHAGSQGRDCVAISNILATGAVPDAMVAAFQLDTAAPLPDRLLRGLEAGLDAGGEKGAVRSANLLVVHVQSFPYVGLRVDVADAPIAALRALWKAYAPQAGLLGPSQA